jgi:hypothetical protein
MSYAETSRARRCVFGDVVAPVRGPNLEELSRQYLLEPCTELEAIELGAPFAALGYLVWGALRRAERSTLR